MNRAFSKILILIIIIVLAGGGISAWQYFGASRKEVKVPEVKTSEEIVQNETANWQTYRNDEFGFELKYPQGWVVRDRELYDPLCDSSYRAGIECSVWFVLEQNPSSLSALEWMAAERFYLAYFPRNQETTVVGGVDGVKATVTLVHIFEGTAVVFGRNDTIYEFVSGNSAVLHRTLSTFRFIE